MLNSAEEAENKARRVHAYGVMSRRLKEERLARVSWPADNGADNASIADPRPSIHDHVDGPPHRESDCERDSADEREVDPSRSVAAGPGPSWQVAQGDGRLAREARLEEAADDANWRSCGIRLNLGLKKLGIGDAEMAAEKAAMLKRLAEKAASRKAEQGAAAKVAEMAEEAASPPPVTLPAEGADPCGCPQDGSRAPLFVVAKYLDGRSTRQSPCTARCASSASNG